MGIADGVVEQIIRPTGLVDPQIVVKPSKGQIDDLLEEIRMRAERDERVLVTTLTKKMAEELTDFLTEAGVRVRYLHSDVDTLRRVELLTELRAGRLRRARRHQPAARGPRPARGVARRDPRRRQGGLPPLVDLAHPDHRPRRPQRLGRGAHVRRRAHRLDEVGDRRDRPPPREAGRVQPGERHRPAAAAQAHRRHHRRARARGGRHRGAPRRARRRAEGARAQPAARGHRGRRARTTSKSSSATSTSRCSRPRAS